MKVVASFEPPNALARAREWREQHADVLSAIPPEAIEIRTGRATGGSNQEIRVADEYADRFPEA
jgi:hypothetical protein